MSSQSYRQYRNCARGHSDHGKHAKPAYVRVNGVQNQFYGHRLGRSREEPYFGSRREVQLPLPLKKEEALRLFLSGAFAFRFGTLGRTLKQH